jgi:hypothetical protein
MKSASVGVLYNKLTQNVRIIIFFTLVATIGIKPGTI